MLERIGFMQGRLSALVEGRIQAFPWDEWQSEFPAAEQLGLQLMEWTLDQDRLYENPLLTTAGQAEINLLRDRNGIRIASLTGDCFMQSPFWKHAGELGRVLQDDFRAIARACSAVGISMMVVPLVDNGRLQSREQEDLLVAVLQENTALLKELDVKVIFESDFTPVELARFIDRLDASYFGINYDIGNSASLGMNPVEEMAAYGQRIVNVHIKDRVRGGTTVPLGTGDADFDAVFSNLARLSYRGNYILQTARAGDGEHAATLGRFRDMAVNWIRQYGA
jgi:L-ribulose-5-phosphate 3-epimerase